MSYASTDTARIQTEYERRERGNGSGCVCTPNR